MSVRSTLPEVTILTGSVHGHARELARHIKLFFEKQELSVSLVETVTLERLKQFNGLFLICTSTTGAGELPANLRPFFENAAQTTQKIEALAYVVVVMGDRHYLNFCGAGKTALKIMERIAGAPCLPMLEIDSSEERTLEIAQEWLETHKKPLIQNASKAKSSP